MHIYKLHLSAAIGFQKNHVSNPFKANIPIIYTSANLPFLYLLKILENLRFSGIFRDA